MNAQAMFTKERKTIDGVRELGVCIQCGTEITTIEMSGETIPLPIRCSHCGKEYIEVIK